MVQITTVKITVDDFFGIGAEEAIFFTELLIIDLFKILKVVFKVPLVCQSKIITRCSALPDVELLEVLAWGYEV
jgi:hypothetical protein